MVMIIAQSEYTGSHRIVHFNRVKSMLCELQLNKVLKKQGEYEDFPLSYLR
jgi:hypothetical protein